MRRLLLFALILSVVFGCANAAQARQAGTNLNLVAYSTPKAVMQKLITRFQHQPAGQGVSFSQSYGPSGAQARAIVAGKRGVINAALVWTHAGRGETFATGNYDFLRMRRSLTWTLLDNVWRKLVG